MYIYYLFLFICYLLIHLNSIQFFLLPFFSLSIGAWWFSLSFVVLLLSWAPKDSSVHQVTGNLAANEVVLILQERKGLHCTIYSVHTFSFLFCRSDFVFPQAVSFTAIFSCGRPWKREDKRSFQFAWPQTVIHIFICFSSKKLVVTHISLDF